MMTCLAGEKFIWLRVCIVHNVTDAEVMRSCIVFSVVSRIFRDFPDRVLCLLVIQCEALSCEVRGFLITRCGLARWNIRWFYDQNFIP